jgi:hypothetical protein
MAIDIYSGPTAGAAGAVYGGGRLDWYFQSTNWTAPAGVSSVKVRVWGAGGGGGYCIDNQSNATGGGGGGYAEKVLLVTPGTSYAVTVGTGGLGGWYDGNNTGTQFTAQSGGSSSFAALVSATGGGGGINTNSTGNYGSGSGGSGSGGDINFSGGAGGAFTNNNYGAGWSATGGGSAAGPWGPGFRGGNIHQASSSQQNVTGGGGTGGQGGDIISSPQSYSNIFTGGGGSAGPAETVRRIGDHHGRPGIGLTVTNNSSFGYSFVAPSTSSTSVEPTGFNQPNGSAGILNNKSRFPGEYLDGSGGGPAYIPYPNQSNSNAGLSFSRGGGNGGPGAGGGGARQDNRTDSWFVPSGGNGGIFGGGGGFFIGTGSTGSSKGRGGSGGIAAGGGACVSYSSWHGIGGLGGNGLVVIEY